MEGQIFHVVVQSNYTNYQLYQWVHKQSQVADLCIRQCKHPKFHAVVELPGVDILEHVFGEVVADSAKVEA